MVLCVKLIRAKTLSSFYLARRMSSTVSTSQCGASLLEAIKSIAPHLTYNTHKGHCGRIGIVGGSSEYTGAPYFAGISALKAGADLSHIICPPEASVAIKSYSPELIVHPFLKPDSFDEISSLMTRLHSMVVGPGLGRDADASICFTNVMMYCKLKNVPVVVDADGLYFICEDKSLIQGYTNLILTPNVVEFNRLYQKVFASEPHNKDPVEAVKELCNSLGNVTIIRKGEKDIISDGVKVICDLHNSPRRCGGQGDLLSGSLGTYLHWAINVAKKGQKNKLAEELGPSLIAGYAACLMTKECNRIAFEKYGRATLTTNMIDVIHLANVKLFDL